MAYQTTTATELDAHLEKIVKPVQEAIKATIKKRPKVLA